MGRRIFLCEGGPPSQRPYVTTPLSRLPTRYGEGTVSGMSTVEEVKEACEKKLTARERAELIRWLRELDDDWDRQIDNDAKSGKLDKFFEQADRDFESGRCRPL